MAEDSLKTQIKTTERAQTFLLTERLAARILGFAFSLCGLLIAAYLATNGHDWVAGIIAGTTIVGVTIALVTGKVP